MVEVRAEIKCSQHPAYMGRRPPKMNGSVVCRGCWAVYNVVLAVQQQSTGYRLRFMSKAPYTFKKVRNGRKTKIQN